MNFNQWMNYADKKDVAKVTYVCGEESTLVELVVRDIKNILDVSSADYATIDAAKSNTFWESASQYGLNPDGNRLTVVRNAEQISSWTELDSWLKQRNPKNFIVFVSAESDGPSVFDQGKRVGYRSHIETIRSKGKFIKCSTPNDDDLIKWCERFGLSQTGAQFLIERTSKSVSDMYSVLRKLKLWNGSPNTNALKILCDEQALDSFADYLVLLDKPGALLALSNLNAGHYSKIISQLNIRLDYMLDINRCVIRRMYDVDIAQATGIKIFLVKRFKSVAREYDFAKVKQRRQLLTVLDSHVQAGAKTGLLESLIVLW